MQARTTGIAYRSFVLCCYFVTIALWAERVSESEMEENFIVGVAEYKQKSNPVIPLEPYSPH